MNPQTQNLPSATESVLVPSSLIRMRGFLGRRGLKVKPWSSEPEVLEALHGVLLDEEGDASFWDDLNELVAELAADAHRRQLFGRSAVDNELLDGPRRRFLLDELRSRLRERQERRSKDGFAGLAHALSGPAFLVLCLLGGAAVVGCGGNASTEDGAGGSAGSSSSSGGATASGGTVSTGGFEAGGATAGGGGTATGGDAGMAGAGGSCTLDEVITRCAWSEETREDLLACVNALNESWHSGLESLLTCTSCDDVNTCLRQLCGNTDALPDDYSLDVFLSYCAVPIYRGVWLD
jgi:hypothetical protein